MERLSTDAIKQTLPLHWDNFLNIFCTSIKNRHKELHLSQELNVILGLLGLSKPYWNVRPRCSPANKVKWHQKLFVTTAWLSPWGNSRLLQGLPDHRHWPEHSATLLGMNSCQTHSQAPGRASLPAACWFLSLCGSPSATAGRERSRRTAAAPSRTHLDDILSRCTAHPALWIKPSPPMSAQGQGMQSLSMHRQTSAIRSLCNPRKECRKKGGENTPTLVTSIKLFFHFYLLGTVMVCYHLYLKKLKLLSLK